MTNPRLCVALRLVCLLLASHASAQESDPTITLAAYNVENMFDVFDNPYTSDEGTSPKSRKAIERVAQTLKAVNADIVGFEEIENEGVLRAMVSEMLADQGYKHIAVLPTNSDRGINLGVISRVPIVSLTSHRFTELTLPDETATWTFARDLLQVTLQATPAKQMQVFIVHLKSRHDGPDDPKSAKWRRAEGLMAHRIISELLQRDPDAWIAIMGDFNDTPDAPNIRGFLEEQDGRPALLRDPHATLTGDASLTYLVGQYRSRIDYLLTSPALYDRLVKSGIHHAEGQTDGSDHAPVWATFNLAE